MSIIEQMEKEKEGMKNLFRECYPHLDRLTDVLAKYAGEGIIDSEGISLFVAADGYISMELNNGWRLRRVKHSEPKITCEIKENLLEEEEEE